MEVLINEVIQAVAKAYANAGWVAALGTFLLFAIRMWRLPFVQQLIPYKIRWEGMAPWMKFAFPFILAFGGTLTISLAGQMAIGAALAAAIAAGLASIGMHHGTKALGAAEMKMRGPEYKPSPTRDKLSLVVPMPKVPPLKDE